MCFSQEVNHDIKSCTAQHHSEQVTVSLHIMQSTQHSLLKLLQLVLLQKDLKQFFNSQSRYLCWSGN